MMRICQEKLHKLPIEIVSLAGGQFRSLSSPVIACTPLQTGRCPVAEQLLSMYDIHIHVHRTILVDIDGHLRKSVKSQLETKLLKLSH